MNNKKRGQRFEEKCRKTINSGATPFDKGDLTTADFVIECKTTTRKSFSITRKILDKLWEEALEANKLPKLLISIPKDDYTEWILSVDLEVRRKT